MKKNLLLNTLAAICLSLVFVSALPMDSIQQYEEYDPWMDVDDNGIINMLDLYNVALRFGTSGDPGNKTELLYNVSNTFAELLARLDILNSTLAGLETKYDELNASLTSKIASMENTILLMQTDLGQQKVLIYMMNASLTAKIAYLEVLCSEMDTRIDELSTLIAVLNATKLGAPDRDSGWIPISQGQEIIFNHNLNTTNVLVYMIGKYSDSASPYIHQIQFGADNLVTTVGGARWYDLTVNSIRVRREANDANWNYVRLFIWKIPPL